MSISHESAEIFPEVDKTNALLQRVDQFYAASSQEYTWVTPEIYKPLSSDLLQYADAIRPQTEPKTINELIVAEASRRLEMEAKFIRWNHGSTNSTLGDAVELTGIPETDLRNLEPWLRENIDAVRVANERLFKSSALSNRLAPPIEISEWDDRIEKLVAQQIRKFHDVVLPLFIDEPGTAKFMDQFLVAPTLKPEKSSFVNHDSHTVGIDARKVVYLKKTESNSVLLIDPVDFTLHWGEECFGHGRHIAFAREAPSLPSFLKTPGSRSTKSTIESIGQYFGNQITTRVMSDAQLYHALGFEVDYRDLMTYYEDRMLMESYAVKLRQLQIYNGARYQKDFKRAEIAEMIQPYCLQEGVAIRGLNNMRRYGNGDVHHTELIRLQYVDQTVDRVIAAAGPEKRADAERLVLYGFWTPQGLRDLAKIALGIDVSD